MLLCNRPPIQLVQIGPEFTDAQIRCEDSERRFPAHRFVLFLCSNHFQRMIGDEDGPTCCGVTLLDVEGVSSSIMEYVLNLIYKGKATFPYEVKDEVHDACRRRVTIIMILIVFLIPHTFIYNAFTSETVVYRTLLC
jgi:hypothetical protein